MTKLVIAIDGYSSCGKSTFAKRIAERLGYLYIDSGAMYRAVTLFFLRNGIIRENTIINNRIEEALNRIAIDFRKNPGSNRYETFLNGENVEEEIRGHAVAQHVSQVAAIPEVRKKLVELQQQMGQRKGIVMDGRDIGTVVFPNADLKLFMTADPLIRAKRRLKELQAKGANLTLEEVLHNIEERDHIDQNRAVSPLRKANDAITLDNSHMSVDEQMEWVERIISDITDPTKKQ